MDGSYAQLLVEERQYYGDACLMYLLGGLDFTWSDLPETDARVAALQALRSHRTAALGANWMGSRDREVLVELLTADRDEEDPPLGVALHSMCGGEIPFVDGSAAERALVRLGMEMLPAFLMRDARFPFSLPTSTYRKRAFEEFRRAAAAGDPACSSFNFSAQEWLTWEASYTVALSDGSGSGVQASGLAVSVLANSIYAPLENESILQAWSRGIRTAFVRAQSLVTGRVLVTTLVGLRGPRLPERAVIELSSSVRLRSFNLLDQRFASDSSGASIALEIDDEVEVSFEGWGDSFPFVSAISSDVWSARSAQVEATRAALLMANERMFATFEASRVALHPGLSGASWSSNPMFVYLAGSETKLTAADAANVKSNFALTVTANPSILVAQRRLVSASGERTDDDDAFVDAVIAWENLLGTNAEIAFRLSAGIAMALKPEYPQERLVLFGRLKKLYSLRSKILHGVRDAHASRDEREEAIELGVKVLRRVLETPSLNGARDAEERSQILLLALA